MALFNNKTIGLMCGMIASMTYAEQGIVDNSIVITQLTPSVAENKSVDSFNLGAKAVFDRANQTKINGKVIVYKTQVSGESVATSYATLCEELSKNSFLFFGLNGPVDKLKPMLSCVKNNKVPLIAPMVNTTSFITNNQNYVYNLKPSIQQEMLPLFTNFETSGLNSIALITQEGYSEYASDVKQIPKFISSKIKVELTLKKDFSNASQIANELKDKDVSILVILAPAMGVRRVVEETQRIYTPFVAISDTISNNAWVQEIMTKASIQALGIWTSSFSTPLKEISHPLVKEYTKEMKNRYGNDVKLDAYSFDGYVSAKYLVENLKKLNGNLTRPALISQLNSTSSDVIVNEFKLSVQESKYLKSYSGVIKDKNNIVY